jgi:hypothetical protein
VRKIRRWWRKMLVLMGIREAGCFYVWIGDRWDADGNTCGPGCTCSPPTYPGSYLGQPASTLCNCP